MNWFGKIIQKYVDPTDIVLDLGCGIMQSTTDILGETGNLCCKVVLGVDVFPKYLNHIKYRYPTILMDIRNTSVFLEKSYDVVLCIDVLEHLEKEEAIRLISEMERIARKSVIIYTPKDFVLNDDHVKEAWGFVDNPFQIHRSHISQEEFIKMGYKVSTTIIDENTFAMKTIEYTGVSPSAIRNKMICILKNALNILEKPV